MPPMVTIFKYNCSCGTHDFLRFDTVTARCDHCGAAYPVSPSGVILFHQDKTEQNVYFDKLYRDGHSHAKDQFQQQHYTDAYHNSMERSEALLKLCGFDMTRPLEHLSILDAACGSGHVTAGLIQNKRLSNCRFHAFDISVDGLNMLARFAENINSSNRLEMSVQHAEAMNFGDSSFDIIIGNSILHHFDSFETFLGDCRRVLNTNGVAIFGEPFAIGYGLGAAALLIAQRDLGTHHQAIEDFYTDISYRVKSPRDLLKKLVDKHIFFQSMFIPLAQKIGFSSVNFVLLKTREYYRDFFINELLLERGISDPRLAERANTIYRVIFDIFDADSIAHSMGSFVFLVLRP
jgi:ubiquinone/menaquinone biosynthesis C-methylase UbiE